ncbi:MAG: DUF559 domain-containing protein [Candidatus Aegiribacteria sp.]|nr:DUF559 domain-containing protein [Candidatus Aegiribacteria sp.]
MGAKRIKPSDYNQLASLRDFKWIGPFPRTTKIKTTWECEAGHQWEQHYNAIQQGRGCPHCAGLVPKNKDDYELLARERGFKWLGPFPKSAHAKTEWRCPDGHTWYATYSKIRMGRGCPVCAGHMRKTPREYHELAKSLGLQWIGTEVQNTNTCTRWKCPCGFEWEATFKSIRVGAGCPDCTQKRLSDEKRIKPDQYTQLAEYRGIIWLGPEVLSTSEKTKWKCKQGHTFESPYNSIQGGHGCPICAGNLPKTLEDYHKLAKDCSLEWLGPSSENTRTKTRWRCKNGHVWKGSYGSVLRSRGCPLCAIKRAAAARRFKNKEYHALAKERGYKWLGPEVLNTQSKTRWLCPNGHAIETTYSHLQQGGGCVICLGLERKTPDDFKALAEVRGFLWLGPVVPNVHTKTQWKCSLGHIWETSFSSIQQGHGCHKCGIEKRTALRRRKPIDYKHLASEHELKWLGPTVKSTGTKTAWECAEGHIWDAPYSMISGGHGCPYCAGLAPKIKADYKKLARDKGFEWIGEYPSRVKLKTRWRCQNGHEWDAPYANLDNGYGCPHCAQRAPKKPEDFRTLAESRGFTWQGPIVRGNSAKTEWMCPEGHTWKANYNSIDQGSGCPICQDMVNGVRVSNLQRKLCRTLNGKLNLKVGRYSIDIAIIREGNLIAIEYDGWYWHGNKTDQDNRRDRKLIEKGWRVLRVKSNQSLPTRNQLNSAIDSLIEGEDYAEIILDDWGVGAILH